MTKEEAVSKIEQARALLEEVQKHHPCSDLYLAIHEYTFYPLESLKGDL